MIGIITLNPCVDRTLILGHLPSEGVYTAERTTCIAGGKGNNVSRVLGSMGIKRRSLVMVAGETGIHIKRMMTEEGLDADFVEVDGMSRTYTTFTDGTCRQIAVKDREPQVSREDALKIKNAFVKMLETTDFLCISGTASCEELFDFPAWATSEAKKRGIGVLLDADGTALKSGLYAAPDYVKPNEEEIASVWADGGDFGRNYLKNMLDLGIGHPLVSLGRYGAVTYDSSGSMIRVIPPEIEAINPVGCGDCFVAGMLYGIINKLDWLTTLKWATAAGTANAVKLETAHITMDEIEPYVKLTEFEYIYNLNGNRMFEDVKL